MKPLNPTGGEVRRDGWGDGTFGAPRGERAHAGVDLCGMPGQWVVAPEAGQVTGTGRPYADGGEWDCYIRFRGVSGTMWRLFYCRPLPGVRGSEVRRGEVIGRLLDVSKKYGVRRAQGAMKPHVHLERVVGGEKVDPQVEG